jgi:hypothetical protein
MMASYLTSGQSNKNTTTSSSGSGGSSSSTKKTTTTTTTTNNGTTKNGGSQGSAGEETEGATFLMDDTVNNAPPLEEATGGKENWGYKITQYGKLLAGEAMKKYGLTENPKTGFATRKEAQDAANALVKKIPGGKYSTKQYLHGGLVDYTGMAVVHGSPSKPEAFLNAKQTAMISDAIRNSGDGGALDGIKATLAALNSTIKSIVNNNDNSI